MTRHTKRPDPSEYDEFYAGYVQQAPEGEIVDVLRVQRDEAAQQLANLAPERGDYRYAPDKWSIKELLGHIADTEWIFTYRALCFARGDDAPLPGMDQHVFVNGGNFGTREIADLAAEFNHVRSANVILFNSFDDGIMDRRGVASDCSFTVRSMLYIIAGHAAHHLRVLGERYN